MDQSSIAIAVANIALFNLLAIFFSIVKKKEYIRRFAMLLTSSFFMFLGVMSLFFEIWLEIGINYPMGKVFVFTTFFSFTYALFILAKMVMSLYGGYDILKWRFIVGYGIVSGFFFIIVEILFGYIGRSITSFFMLAIPFYYMLRSIYLSEKKFWGSPFVFQISLIAIFYGLKIMNLFILDEAISLTDTNSADIAYTMFTIIIVITMYAVYLVEFNHISYEKLAHESKVLEQTLTRTKELSETDTLTGLYNRKKIYDYLDLYYELYTSKNSQFSLAMIDVDSFKSVNDNFGHSVGDEVLKFVAEKLIHTVREKDRVGRLGGDEFIVIFPDTSPENHQIIKDKIKESFSSELCEHIKDFVSLSIGIASIQESENLDKLVIDADNKMYLEKQIYRKNR